VGLGLSFKNSRLDPDGKILQPSPLCSSPQEEVAPAGFCVFPSDPDPHPESKFFEKPDPHPESLFNLGSSRSLCDHFLIKKRADVRCMNR